MRKIAQRLLITATAGLLILSAGFSVSAGQGQAEKLSLASFKSGSGWYIMAQTMARTIKGSLPPGSQVDVLPYAGGVGNPLLLAKGKADLALGFPVEAGLAVRGEPPYKRKVPIKALVGNLDISWYVFSVRAATPIKSLADIKKLKYPLRLAVMPKGSSGEWNTRKLLEAYGVSFADIESWGGKVSFVSFPTAVEMMKDGQADAFGQICTPGHPSWTQLATMTKLRFLPFGKKVVEDFSAKYGFNPAVLPKGTFPGVDQDVPVLGFATLVMTTDKLSDELAYKVTKALCTNQKALENAYKGCKAFDPKNAANVPLPLHPGALKYYREAGIIK
ncbi:MAG: TAXI family TRAP transporter solute-binding subunit [Deltaproteobacteria bacterium]|nr:TAXI family TRAP transporter solute-binding subunit [Deltaproteobacteria bacterium]